MEGFSRRDFAGRIAVSPPDDAASCLLSSFVVLLRGERLSGIASTGVDILNDAIWSLIAIPIEMQ